MIINILLNILSLVLKKNLGTYIMACIKLKNSVWTHVLRNSVWTHVLKNSTLLIIELNKRIDRHCILARYPPYRHSTIEHF